MQRGAMQPLEATAVSRWRKVLTIGLVVAGLVLVAYFVFYQILISGGGSCDGPGCPPTWDYYTPLYFVGLGLPGIVLLAAGLILLARGRVRPPPPRSA